MAGKLSGENAYDIAVARQRPWLSLWESSDCQKSVFSQIVPMENVGAIIDRPKERSNKSQKNLRKYGVSPIILLLQFARLRALNERPYDITVRYYVF